MVRIGDGMWSQYRASCISTAAVGKENMPYTEIHGILMPQIPIVRGSLVVVFLTIGIDTESDFLLFSHWVPDPVARTYDTQPQERLLKALDDARRGVVNLSIPALYNLSWLLSIFNILEFEIKEGAGKRLV